MVDQALVEQDSAPPDDTGRSSWWILLLLLPCLLLLGAFFAYPMIGVVLRSFSGDDGSYSLEHYRTIYDRTVYLRVFLITIEISLGTTFFCLLIGYPIAYAIAHAPPRLAGFMIALVLVPFFTSMLVRTYAWMVILSPNGPLTHAMSAITGTKVQLIYNRAGVYIGMVYTMLPYMVLTLYSIMKGIDTRLPAVARSLGASDWSAFCRIYLPLSLPGIAGGSLLVFILSSGFYIVPKLMGGSRDQMLASVIAFQVDSLLNWNFASALSVLLLIITLVGFAIYARLLGLKQLLSSKF